MKKTITVLKGAIVEIDWIDSCADVRTWVSEDDFDFNEHDNAMYHQSIGYFIKKTKVATYICLSARVNNESGGSNLSHLFSIPNAAILSIREIK